VGPTGGCTAGAKLSKCGLSVLLRAWRRLQSVPLPWLTTATAAVTLRGPQVFQQHPLAE